MSAPDENHVVSSEKVSPCSVEKATSCNFCLEILNVSHSLATSMPRNVSLEQRYSFFVKLISGNDIDVFIQTSYDGKEWFIDSPVRTLNRPPLFTTDRVVLMADHYACLARIGANPRENLPGKLQIVFQAPPAL